jgi:N-acyl-phosphatidylethanolamine-hydrolysing phospholipase D
VPGLVRSLLLLLTALACGGCVGVGGPVPGAPVHHRQHGFANAEPGHAPASGWTRWTFFARRVLGATFRPRSADLPRVANDGATLRANTRLPTVTWVGHATVLLQLDGVNLLTDPQWSDRASPVGFAGPRRVSAPGLRFEDLPPIHAVVISHDHYDHLDVATVRRLAREHRPRFLVPLGLKTWFVEQEITNVDELDWWQSRSVGAVEIICVPAQHFSGRTLWDRNKRLWSGWVVRGHDRRFYVTGDTAYAQVFKEIGARLGPLDLAAIHIGAYLPPVIMKASHTTPEESLDIFADVGARVMVPIHWGTFDLADEPLEEPPQRLEAEAKRRSLGPDRIWLLKFGETRGW